MNVARIFLSVVVLALVVAGVVMATIETVPVAKIGVRQERWGGGGIGEKDFAPGFHLGISGYHKWYFLDRRTHFLTFANKNARSSQGQSQSALTIRTDDENLVTFDVSVTYRIIPGEAFRLVKDGLHEVYRDQVASRVEKTLRDQLGKLQSEDYYDTDKRIEIAKGALPGLRAVMAEYYVEPESVLIRAVAFAAEYENKLQDKQLSYQKRDLAMAERKVEDQRAITEKLSAEIEAAAKELKGDWDKRLQEISSTNKVTIAEILAKAEVYEKEMRAAASADYETLVAEGSLAIDKAEALRNELRNKALDTLGGRIYLARQAAENLQFDHVTLNSNDPSIPSILDINELVKLLVGEQKP